MSQYRMSGLDNIENVEMYRPGGFHPVSIGDVFANGRYKVLHKLGRGSSSIVWLGHFGCIKGSFGRKILQTQRQNRRPRRSIQA